MTLDAFLADPALRPVAPMPDRPPAKPVRFRLGSDFAARMGLPSGTRGLLVRTWREDGETFDRGAVVIHGVPGIGYATGALVADLEVVCSICGRVDDGAACGVGGCPCGGDL